MPFGDGTGPAGQGAMTGRGLGYCVGYDRPGYTKTGFGGRYSGRGRGFGWYGRGGGGGRGYRNWYRAAGLTGRQRAGYEYPVWERRGYYPSTYPSVQPTAKEEKGIIEEDKKAIQQEIDALKDEMKDREERLKELNRSKKKK